MIDQKTLDGVKKSFDEILNRAGLRMGFEISFPVYRILPDEVKLALSILNKHGFTISIVLKPKSEKPTS
jgi:hypothetical protein